MLLEAGGVAGASASPSGSIGLYVSSSWKSSNPVAVDRVGGDEEAARPQHARQLGEDRVLGVRGRHVVQHVERAAPVKRPAVEARVGRVGADDARRWCPRAGSRGARPAPSSISTAVSWATRPAQHVGGEARARDRSRSRRRRDRDRRSTGGRICSSIMVRHSGLEQNSICARFMITTRRRVVAEDYRRSAAAADRPYAGPTLRMPADTIRECNRSRRRLGPSRTARSAAKRVPAPTGSPTFVYGVGAVGYQNCAVVRREVALPLAGVEGHDRGARSRRPSYALIGGVLVGGDPGGRRVRRLSRLPDQIPRQAGTTTPDHRPQPVDVDADYGDGTPTSAHATVAGPDRDAGAKFTTHHSRRRTTERHAFMVWLQTEAQSTARSSSEAARDEVRGARAYDRSRRSRRLRPGRRGRGHRSPGSRSRVRHVSRRCRAGRRGQLSRTRTRSSTSRAPRTHAVTKAAIAARKRSRDSE